MRRLAGFALAAAAGLAPGLSACDDGAAVLAPAAIDVGAPRYHVVVANDGRAITLRRGEAALLTLGADAFQLGVVDALDDTASYDPYALDGRESDAGVTYHAPLGFHAAALAPDAGATVTLDYGGELRVTVEDPRRGERRLHVHDDAQRERRRCAGDRGAAHPCPHLG